jgi:hypothetical protein
MKEIILKLPTNVIDQIGNILADRPYKEVKGILDTIVMQANDMTLQSYREPVETKDVVRPE